VIAVVDSTLPSGSACRLTGSLEQAVVDAGGSGGHTGGVAKRDLLDLISIDPAICHGQPCIGGTRVLVTVVLDALAAGLASDEIVRHYPTLTAESVRAAAAYGAWLAKQEIHVLPVA
jgi:uncharacterized protein (DUF433 family)